MFIDIDDDDINNLLEKVYTNNATWKDKERLVLPTFDLYGKMTGDGNDDNPITTFAYEIRTTFKTYHVFKKYLSNLSMDSTNDIKFISYGLNSMVNKNTVRNIIKNNKLLSNMEIVSIFGVTTDKEEKVYNIFSKMAYFTGMEKIRKQEEGK